MRAFQGPFPINAGDIAALNQVFSDAFTERYRRDGLVGVRVPMLNHAIWEFSIEDAAGGAMLWRDAEGNVAAFNVAHHSGIEGWMGPLAVRTEYQGQGLGKRIVRAGVEWLHKAGATTIGLETMPRTVDNIGFYSSLGFVAGPLTVTFTLESREGEEAERIGAHRESARERLVAECAALTNRIAPALDFSREIRLTGSLGLGDTLLVRDGGALVGFALCHNTPLVEGRAPEELRVLKVVLADEAHMDIALDAIVRFARESALQRAAVRVQGNYESAYAAVVAAGARVRWTDLRMTLRGFPERRPAAGLVLSNWEI
jgi:GNAT superfamily N-acetyltransferase